LAASAYVIAVRSARPRRWLTVPTVLAAGVADGFNPVRVRPARPVRHVHPDLVNSVTADGAPTSRRAAACSGPARSTSVPSGDLLHHRLGLLSFLGWLGQDHLVTGSGLLALVMPSGCSRTSSCPDGTSMMAPPGPTAGCTGDRARRSCRHAHRRGARRICTVPCSGAIYLTSWPYSTPRVRDDRPGPPGALQPRLHPPLVVLLLAVSDRRCWVGSAAGTGQQPMDSRPVWRSPCWHELRPAGHDVSSPSEGQTAIDGRSPGRYDTPRSMKTR